MSFLKHILPYYAPALNYVAIHLIYYNLNGNLMWVLLTAYVVNFPYYRWTCKTPKKEINFDRVTERVFAKDKRFLGPIYLYVLFDSLTWVWCLCVVSGVYPSWMPKEFFKDRITQTLSG